MAPLECTVDGYVQMVNELMELIFIFASWAVNGARKFLPPNLSLALKYGYRFVTGIGSWIGYALAGFDYFAEEYGYGELMCEIMGYGYVAIDALYFLVDFGAEYEDGDETPQQ